MRNRRIPYEWEQQHELKKAYRIAMLGWGLGILGWVVAGVLALTLLSM